MQIQFIQSLKGLASEAWNQLWPGDYPFVRYEFLAALEDSGCTTAPTGWQAFHGIASDGDRLLGAMPLYLKTHSYGEYVFDWSWANAYHQAGYEYYPKLINAIPFTPATGPRLGVNPDLPPAQQQQVVEALLVATLQIVEQKSLSGFHSLFPSSQDAPTFAEHLLQRLDCQYHWFNQNYSDFDDFLQTFSSRKRKNVNKERARVAEQGFTVHMVEGGDLNGEDWQHFYQLYRRTYLKRSGHDGYLNESFFQQIGAAMSQHIVMAQAWRDGEWCAAALYLKDATTLYGRYWGALEEFDALHFECCYYQGVEYAIRRKLQRFDPGAQGEHKIARGFTPVLTQSFHYLQEPAFASAIRRFLIEEKEHLRMYCDDARQQLPFKFDHPLVPADCLIAPPLKEEIKNGN
jgi:predicted N-acyltransferase